MRTSLSTGARAEAAYRESAKVQRITEFWSHSWHSQSWQKIALLMARYNGAPAVAAGTLAALLFATLAALDILPAMTPSSAGDNRHYSCWALLAGTSVSMATLPLWESQCRVFLDRACIHQTDAELKKQGVESIGAFLKQSDFMLVLWDASYVTRLWCVFEIAAYLRTHDGVARNCRVRPVILGPLSFAIYAGLVSIYLYFLMDRTDTEMRMYVLPVVILMATSPLMHVLREYHRSLRVMKGQLQHFSFASARCFCCSTAHVSPDTGEELVCDRELVEACIKSWFGSVANFESEVQAKLFVSFEQQLGAHAFPYHWLVCAMTPALWAHMDIVAATLSVGDWHEATVQFVYTLSYWLCAYPLFFVWLVKTSAILVGKQRHAVLDVLISIAGAVASAVPACSIWWAQWLSRVFHNSEILSSLAYLASIALLAGVVWSRGRPSC